MPSLLKIIFFTAEMRQKIYFRGSIINAVLKMTVIYVDILVVLNFFITLLLLLVTAKLSKRKTDIKRTIAAALLGGAYSLVILIDGMPPFLSVFLKLPAACFIVLAAFQFRSLFAYIKEVVIFFFTNLLFVGIIVGLWLIFRPAGVVVNNSTVYFNVSAKLLLLSAVLAYLISSVIIKIYNGKTAAKALYEVTVYAAGSAVKFFAFADSGNRLREPFSDFPVIVAEKSLFENVKCSRVIPCQTVSGSGVLYAFQPDRVQIRTAKGVCSVENVFVALSDNVNRGEYKGIINPSVLEEGGEAILRKKTKEKEYEDICKN